MRYESVGAERYFFFFLHKRELLQNTIIEQTGSWFHQRLVSILIKSRMQHQSEGDEMLMLLDFQIVQGVCCVRVDAHFFPKNTPKTFSRSSFFWNGDGIENELFGKQQFLCKFQVA